MQVFLSYSWNDSEAADEIQKLCNKIGISLIRDKYNLEYSENIPEFAEKINDCDFVICLVSNAYLKSFRCLYEVLILLKTPYFEKKVCCIVIQPLELDIFKRIEFIEYWNKQKEKIIEYITYIPTEAKNNLLKDLLSYEKIVNRIDDFLSYVCDNKYISIEEIYLEGISVFLKTVVHKMGFLPYAHIEFLCDISDEQDFFKQKKLLEDYKNNFGENEYYYYVKANIYERKKYYDLALYYYQKSIEYNSEYSLAIEAIISLFLNNEEIEKIDKYFRKLKKINPNDSCIYRIEGLLSIFSGKFLRAKELYETYLEKVPDDYAAYNTLGIICEKTGVMEYINEAKYHYEQSIELNKDYYQAYNNLAIWYMKYEENFSKCIALCDKCLQIYPEYYYSHNVKGLALVREANYNEAFEELCKSLLLSPVQHALPINNMGYLIQEGFKDYAAAKLFYLFSMKRNDVEAYLNYAIILFNIDNDYENAFIVAKKGWSLDRSNVLLKFLCLLSSIELGNIESCLSLCNECIDIDCTYWPSYFMKMYLMKNNAQLIFNSYSSRIKEDIKKQLIDQKIFLDFSDKDDEKWDIFYRYICWHFNEFSISKVNREMYLNLQNLNDIRKEYKENMSND